MLTYDAETALVLLHDACNALLVDVSLCVDVDAFMSAPKKELKERNNDRRWALERKSYVWVVGYLERVDVSDADSRYAWTIISWGMHRLFPPTSQNCPSPCFQPSYHHLRSIHHLLCVP